MQRTAVSFPTTGKRRTRHSESAFLNPRTLAACLLCSGGALLAAFTLVSAAPGSTSGQAPLPALVAGPASCGAPGTLITSDPAGDQTGAPSNSQSDIQSVSIAEPCVASGANTLLFTIKVANLS